MVIGFTALKVVPGKERSVYGTLRRRDGIRDIYYTIGEYDIFVILHADEVRDLDRIAKNIHDVHYVLSASRVLVEMDEFARMGGASPQTYPFEDHEALLTPESL